MGTSKRYGGSHSGLVPSWVDDKSPIISPVLQRPPVPTGPGGGPGPTQPPAPVIPPNTGPRLPPPAPPGPAVGDFSAARAAFTRFARTRSRSDLGSALSHYVGGGSGGAGRAARRMGMSRAAGSRMLGIVRDVQRVGAEAVLRSLNLEGMSDRPADEVFVAMLEYVCPPGGTVDEAIARDALLDAIRDLSEAGIESFEAMTLEDHSRFFIEFTIRSIEAQVLSELFQRGIQVPATVSGIEYVEQQLHGFVAGCIRSQLDGRLTGVQQMSNTEIDRTVREVYEAAFTLVEVAANREAGA